MSLLIAIALSFVSGFFGRGVYDGATQAAECSEVYQRLISDYGAQGLQYMGPRSPGPGIELHGWIDADTGEVSVYAFLGSQELALEAQNQGFTGRGTCLTPSGMEMFLASKLVAPPPVGDEAGEAPAAETEAAK